MLEVMKMEGDTEIVVVDVFYQAADDGIPA